MWEEFWLHELVEIVRQSSDPDFVQLCNRVQEGQQTNSDLMQIKPLANTDTTTWPNKFVKVYLNNYLADLENEDSIGKLDSEVVTKTQDTNKDVETNTCSISIPDNIGLAQTVNLPAKLKLCVGARVMLTENINVSNRLIKGSIGTVKYLVLDDPKAVNSSKGKRLRSELKECIQITATILDKIFGKK